jgi:tellurite resistance protein TehA-like permease
MPDPENWQNIDTARNSATTVTYKPGHSHANSLVQSEATARNSLASHNVADEKHHANHHLETFEEHGLYDIDINDPNRPRLGIRDRLHHFTWAWFVLPMSTGGLSLLIFAQPHQFPGLKSIGMAVYVINIIIFACVVICLITRFFLWPGDMKKSVTHQREGFFVPTFFLSLATLITSTQRYALPTSDSNMLWAIQTAFWGYVILALTLAVGQYSYVFAARSFALETMMPTWILPIFPIMLTGTIASVIAETQPAIAAVPILVAGLTCQGLGLSVAVMMYAHMVGRLMVCLSYLPSFLPT